MYFCKVKFLFGLNFKNHYLIRYVYTVYMCLFQQTKVNLKKDIFNLIWASKKKLQPLVSVYVNFNVVFEEPHNVLLKFT